MHKRTVLGLIFLFTPILVVGISLLIGAIMKSISLVHVVIIVLMGILEVLLCCPAVLLLVSGSNRSSEKKRISRENPDFSGFVSESELESKKTWKRGSKQKSPKQKKEKVKKEKKSKNGDVEFTF